MGGGASNFLDNIRVFERRVELGMYWYPNRLPMQRDKQKVQDLMFKINCAPSLFGACVNKSSVSRMGEIGVLPNIEHINEGVGYWIYRLREKNVPDQKIYDTLVDARDSYLKERGLCESDFGLRRMSIKVYNATKKGLMDLMPETN